MGFFVLPIFDGVIMDGHPIFWVVSTTIKILDAHPLWHHRRWAKQKVSSLIFSFLVRIVLFSQINVSIQETKFIAWRSSREKIPFAYRCVTWYAVFTRVKYATTPRNCWTRYPPHYSNGWAEFCSEPLKLLLDKLNHAHWLRILIGVLTFVHNIITKKKKHLAEFMQTCHLFQILFYTYILDGNSSINVMKQC